MRLWAPQTPHYRPPCRAAGGQGCMPPCALWMGGLGTSIGFVSAEAGPPKGPLERRYEGFRLRRRPEAWLLRQLVSVKADDRQWSHDLGRVEVKRSRLL